MYNSFHAVHNLLPFHEAKNQILTTFRKMNFFSIILTVKFLLVLSYSYSQDTIPLLIEDVEYKLYRGMDDAKRKELISVLNIKDIEVAPFADVDFPVRVTFQNGKQNLMRFGEVEYMHKKNLDSITFFTATSR